jgi:hypothetical protein
MECEEVGGELYHWSDITTNIPQEVNESNKYGGPELRKLLRMVAMNIEDVSIAEATARGWGQFAFIHVCVIECR